MSSYAQPSALLALVWHSWRHGGNQVFTLSVVLFTSIKFCHREHMRNNMIAYRHWYFWKFPGWKACVILYVCWAVVRVKSEISANWKRIVAEKTRQACYSSDKDTWRGVNERGERFKQDSKLIVVYIFQRIQSMHPATCMVPQHRILGFSHLGYAHA
jgi:hypothetical protein